MFVVLVEELGAALAPLGKALDSPDSFHRLALELGWDLDTIPQPVEDVLVFLAEIVDLIQAGEIQASDVPQLIAGIRKFFEAVNDIATSPDGAFPPGLDAALFKADFPKQLVEFLIVSYLADHHPRIEKILVGIGLIRVTRITAAGGRPTYFKRQIVWGELGNILENPLQAVANVYKWGTSDFDANLFLDTVMELANAFDVEIELERPDEALLDYLNKDATKLNDSNRWSAKHVIFRDYIEDVFAEAGIGLFVLPETAAVKPGFSILPYAEGSFTEAIPLTDELQLVIEAGFDLTLGVGVVVRPDRPIDFVTDIIPSSGSGTAPPSSGFMTIGVQNSAEPESKTVLIGSPTGSRFETSVISVTGGVRIDSASATDVFAEFKLSDAAVVIAPGGDADSFISSLLPEDGFAIDFSLLLGVSSSQGFYFGGSGGLEIALPAHIDLGVIEITSSTLAVKPGADGIPIELGGTIKGNLGPLQAVVENIGLRATFTFPPDSRGNLGPADLVVGFKPPNGVGLSIDAGVVKGGGYLYFDFDKGEYAGVLELDLNGIVAVKAVGLITTKMPDGSTGFSLLLIITAEFGTPIQLGLGFTLSGVGGLLGLNRTMRLDVIATGIREGGINSIMFPTDVIANAPRIISDLKRFFPTQNGTFLIGPMVKIGWGTPNLVTLSVGIIIEIPGNIAIVGVLKVALPDEETAQILIQVSFIGAIEFDKERLWFFATLFGSRVLYITLEGDMGLLVAWGKDSTFLISVGGFHPSFKPPALPFGNIRRIAIGILNTDYARIGVQGYFAVTSNTVQFGARVEVWFGLDAFNIDGHLSFDALFRFSPFYFIVSISASLSVKVFGAGLFSVRMRGDLEGPSPWHIEGEGSISFLFFDISVDFSLTWGNEEDTKLPPLAVMPLLKDEYLKLENWQAVLPANNKLRVALREAEESAVLVLHPAGSLRVSQRAVPLEVTIDKVGNQKPSDANRFSLSVSTAGLDEKGDVDESFASGQFFARSDSALLSAPSFEPMKGGAELSVTGEQYRSSMAVRRSVRYEKIVIDTHYRRFVVKFYAWLGSLFALFLGGNAVSLSPVSYKSSIQKRPFDDGISVGANLYAVVRREDNTPFADEAIHFTSQASANEYLREQIAAQPALAEQLQAVPQIEMQEAA